MALLVSLALASTGALADTASAKIAPAVRRAMLAGNTKHHVLILTDSRAVLKDGVSIAGVSMHRGTPRAVRVAATPAQISKLAQSPNVIAVVPDEAPPRPPVPGPQMLPGMAHPAGALIPLPNTWKATDVVGARAAWDLGYTGKGVKVAIVDERVDFAHPDLQGTQARVEDPNSPYFGWPIAFDPYSMETYARTGRTTSTGYCFTPIQISESNPVIGSYTYILPGTSKSGVYRAGSHPSYWLRFLQPSNRGALVLLADEHQAGVYDTVYVDLDKDLDFTDEKPCRRGDEVSWHDLDGDGIADLSGGMVYFIADGVHPIPASDWLYNLPPPANGTLICFIGSFEKYESHGTLCASAIAAQGVVGAGDPPYRDIGGGAVRGTAPDAKIISIGNVYNSGHAMYDAVLFATLGYDGQPNTGDEPDIVNMSFGYSNVDNDGWDYLARYITYLNITQAPCTTFLGATGNGGPGYGTVTSPGAAPSVISVGASTLYGSVPVLDDIISADQILYGDIQPWSNRGPTSMGFLAPDVLAIGAWATGDVPIFGDGANSWGLWGGTSLACPMAAGVLATVYQAYRESRGTSPTFDQARDLLMSGASNLNYPVLEQGAGQVDARRSVKIARSEEVTASPSSWQVGQPSTAFPGAIPVGQSIGTNFVLSNPTSRPVTADLASETLTRISEITLNVQAINSEETPEFAGPSYLIDLLPLIPQGADLLRVRAAIPFGQTSLSDPASPDVTFDNGFSLAVYDWTDLDSNGVLWHDDVVPNNVVNEGELDPHELNRYSYSAPAADCLEVSVQSPLSRHHDGVFLGVQHYKTSEDIPVTDIKLTLEFYRRSPWKMLSVRPSRVTVGANRKAVFRAVFSADAYTKPGVYSGAIGVTTGTSSRQTIPVIANVTNPPAGEFPWSLMVWGSDLMNAPYDNGLIRGAYDWGWRPESGDWRFYYYTPPQPVTARAVMLANANWQDYPTDVDVLLYGPNRSDYFSQQLPAVFGPYSMVLRGGSLPTNMGSPVWPFQTTTGGPSEWVSAPMTEPGNYLAMLHSVLSAGRSAGETLSVNAGPVVFDPAELAVPVGAITDSIVRLTPYLYLWDGMEARAYGFSDPIVKPGESIRQDPMDSPDSASWHYDLTVAGAGLLEVRTASPAAIDIDLYVIRDSNGDGYFDWNTEMVGMSAGAGASEKVSIPLPADGAYRVAVHGYEVRPSPSAFSIRIGAVEGNQIAAQPPAGRVLPGSTADLGVRSQPTTAGEGIVFIGPRGAPTAMQIRVHAQ